jgi:hypothetical protein
VPAVVLLLAAELYSQEAKPAFKATASDVVGEPEVTRAGREEGEAIKNGTEVHEGDTVLTGFKESLTLTFDDGSKAHIPALAEIKVTRSLVENEAARISLRLNFGEVRASVPPLEKKTEFTVSTPTMTCSVGGTDWSIRANVDMPDTVQMGPRGLLYVSVQPTMPLGPNQGTNSNLINPIDLARLRMIVRQTQFGTTPGEKNGNDESSIPLYPNPADYMMSPSQLHAIHQRRFMGGGQFYFGNGHVLDQY